MAKKGTESALPAEPTAPPYPEPKSIQEARLNCQHEAGYVRKGGRAGSGSYAYSFAGERDIIAKCRPVLIKWGVVETPIKIEPLPAEGYTTDKGSGMRNFRGLWTWEFVHVPTNTTTTIQTVGEGADQGDKSCSKASTTARKYAIREFFLLETGDDPDATASADLNASGTHQTAQAGATSGNGRRLQLSPDESYRAACDALARAPTVAALEQYKLAIQARTDYTLDQKQDLERRALARQQQLAAPSAQAAPQSTSTGQTPVNY